MPKSPEPGLIKVHPEDQLVVSMRLQRFLARAGVASRRGSESLITAGRVCVNGQCVTELGTKVDPKIDTVSVDGVPVELGKGAAYILLNKPSSVLTTMSDPQGRPTVAGLVPTGEYPGLYPVGRLDFDTTGLLLFTTDGDFGQLLLHPSHHVWKTYIAVVQGTCSVSELDILRKGAVLDDGPCQPAHVDENFDNDAALAIFNDIPQDCSVVQIEIHEGRKNQVKRMFASIGHPVVKLHRSRLGNLELGNLQVGSWRNLTQSEVDHLKQDAHEHV